MNLSASDLATPATAATLFLFSMRIGGLLLIAPVFSSRTVPAAVKVALLAVLSWVMFPLVLTAGAPVARITFAGAMSEALVGMAIGLGAAVFVGAMEAMGDLLAVQIGLSGAATLDPLTHNSVPVLGQFANLFGIALLLSVNAHLLMLEAVAGSLRMIPVGAPLSIDGGLAAMAGTGSTLFLLGVRFAAPVVATVLLGNVALAVLARAAPQVQILAVAFPMQIGLGLLALVAAIPIIGAYFTTWSVAYEGMLQTLLGALAGGG